MAVTCRRGRESRGGLAAALGALRIGVGLAAGVEELGFGILVRGQGHFWGDGHAQLGGSMLGVLQGIGHHDGHRLAGVKHLVRLHRHERHLHRWAHRLLALLGFGRHCRLGQVLVGEDGHYARLALGCAGIKAGNTALGHVAGFNDGVHQARQVVVLGRIFGRAGHLGPAIDAAERLADGNGLGGSFKKGGFAVHGIGFA